MNNFDAYFKKIVQYKYRDKDLKFRVSQSLFSSYDIDFGTQRLLRTLISEKFDSYNKVLDLGCGYGPIGIALKSAYKPSIVHMVDRDALALEYSRQNAELNSIKDIKTYGSLGYDDITETNFDLIISNIPAKVGEKALSHMLEDAQFYLHPEGRVAVVVIDPIAEYVSGVLTKNPYINILFHKAWPGHVVFHYKFSSDNSLAKPKKSAFDRGIFDRDQKVFSFGKFTMSMQTTYGLSEFDTLSYETAMLLDSLKLLQNRGIKRATVFNPRQGHVSVGLSLLTKVQKITLVDRDLQALRVSKRNLVLNGYSSDNISLLHQVGISLINQNRSDYVIGVLPEEDGPIVHEMFVKQAALQLNPGGLVILSSRSTPITRVENFVRAEKLLDVLERRRSKGNSTIILKHKS